MYVFFSHRHKIECFMKCRYDITWRQMSAMAPKFLTLNSSVNTLRPSQYGRHFPDDILKCSFLNEDVWISLTISLKCVRKVRINNIPSLVQIMAWRRPGDKPLSEPMMISLLTHICVTRPQWVNSSFRRTSNLNAFGPLWGINCWIPLQRTSDAETFACHNDINFFREFRLALIEIVYKHRLSNT